MCKDCTSLFGWTEKIYASLIVIFYINMIIAQLYEVA